MIFLLATAALAQQHHECGHAPPGGFPTTANAFYKCCNCDDCKVAVVEVASYSGAFATIRSTVGNFVVPRVRIHNATNMEANEFVCTPEGEPPKRDGSNVICVFDKKGMF